ncbi:FAD:protein FMN transferase [Neobacillus sp. FSL H8-0543]|uniref:FAD:protein FMN transferase n=1 Tax=Neobacillus sp. FSL H8-0543 TaxID=2954672 RepID=UPI0031590B60
MITKGKMKVTVLLEEHNENMMDSVRLNIMNTSFYMAISNENHTHWKKTIISFLQYMDREFSRFRSDNELRRLNEAKRDSVVVVSPILFDLLRKAEKYRLITGGRFSPYILTQLEAHGYNQSFPLRLPIMKRQLSNIKINGRLLFFKEGCQIIKKTDQKIDLGGIG